MTYPEWTKPGVNGAVGGAIAVSILRFNWGGWTAAGTAQKMAHAFAVEQVTEAMVPVCLSASAADPERAAKLATLKDTSSFKRRNAMMATGWTSLPGSDEPNRELAVACLERLEQDGS